MSPSDTPRIGYVLKMYPRFSETFVLTEVLSLEEAGASLEIFSLRPPVDARFHADLARVQAPVTWVDSSSVRASEAWQRLREAATRLPRLPGLLPELLEADARDALQAVAVADAAVARGLDHLHAHFGSVATTVARLAARLAGITYSFTAHAKDVFHESVDDDDLRQKLRDAAAVVTVSAYNVAHLRERFGADAGRVRQVNNGIDLDAFAWRSPRQRPRHVVAVGRLVEKKGFGDLVEALHLLRASGDPVTCDVVGSGPLLTELAARVAALGLTDRVRLLGPRTQDEVRAAVSAAAVMAAPCVVGDDGNRDGLPTVVLEAMALGTPVVSTPVTGIPEVVRDGDTGLLVPERDPAALARALRRLLDDADLRERTARAARSLVESGYDRRDQARRLRAMHAEVLAGGHRSRAVEAVPA
ncbi:glycosyltransferase [Aquipuribacter nitratireducens]|uniref:Glycosyltransferase n=1 Tax=Aquipuribacter nitratireducens TaxID=650104 RepID=A0ABW0GQF2_9MICO